MASLGAGKPGRGTDPARVTGAIVTFEPGARAAWHTHPLGQTLIVTAGCGLAQRWGGPIEQIRTDEVIWFPLGEKHWHGATATTAVTHIANQEQLDGKAVEWMEHVGDERYHFSALSTRPPTAAKARLLSDPNGCGFIETFDLCARIANSICMHCSAAA